ncbi:MAG: ThiF family adenylyltransferase, partial [Planctomycetota bacterium]
SKSWRLVVLRHAWADAWRKLTVAPSLWAVAALRWNNTNEAHELLAEQLAITSSRPDGISRPPADDWLVLARADFSLPTFDIRRFIAQLAPRPSQTLLVLLVDESNHAHWDARVFRRGTLHAVGQVVVVGPEMLILDRDKQATEADDRWSRTRGALGVRVANKIRKSEITLIGAGRNGSAAAFQFASLGVSRLRIIDGDTLGVENMDAMVGFTSADVGRSKSHVLAERLQQLRPDMAITAIDRSVLEPAAEDALKQRSGLLVTCVDHDTPRLAAAIAARRTLTPHLDIGTSVQTAQDGSTSISGDARLLLPGDGCVACVGGVENLEASLYDLQIPADHLHHKLRAPWHRRRAGSLITINAMTVGAAVQMWLDLLAGELRGSHWHRLAWRAGSGLACDAGQVSAVDSCRICHPG